MLELPPVACSITFFISFQELISQMLQVNVEARCTAGQILSHPWVSVSTPRPRGTTISVSCGQQRASSPGLLRRQSSASKFRGGLTVCFL